MKKEEPVGTPDKHETDEVSHLEGEDFQEQLLRLLDVDDDLETAADAMIESDLEALDAWRTTAEMVERCVTNAKEETSPHEYEQTTRISTSPTTDTLLSGSSPASEPTPEFLELLERLHECKQNKRLSWSHDYRKKKEIGRGGQGVVYLTECINQNHLPKALKVLSPEPYGDVESYQEDMKRMKEVFSLVYSMQVDNLVIVEDFAAQQGISMMIMRWIDGCDLATLLKPGLLDELRGRVDEKLLKHLNESVVTNRGTMGTQSRLKPGMAVNIIEKCLRALDALHSQGIVHGDIKPANIMLDRYGSIRMVDIGSAFQQSALPRRHTWTPRYAPPEFFAKDGQWTPQGDLASLGYVLIEMLSGRPPIAGPDIESVATRLLGTEWDQQLMVEKLQLPNRLDELMPKEVRESERLMDILRRLIAPEPEKRFANAEEALIGPSGTYQFMQGLARMDLAAPFSHEIRRWIEAVLQVRPASNAG
jgi:serine/threonine-protein kinase